MPTREVLLLAMTRMRSGICVAGFTTQPDRLTGLQWVRPVRDFETVQPGDMSDESGRLFQCGDVVELQLLEPRPDPPHVEDWLTDFVYRRPKFLRRLKGEKRSRFFPRYLDPAPQDVVLRCSRSLCLVMPSKVCAHFVLKARYQARMSFELMETDERGNPLGRLWRTGERGIPVTDLKWRALGKGWVDSVGGQLRLETDELCTRLNVDALYLTVGLSRAWKGRCWPLVVGVHTVPDYEISADLSQML